MAKETQPTEKGEIVHPPATPPPEPGTEETGEEATEGPNPPIGGCGRLFAGTHGETRAKILDVLGVNSSRQFTTEELARQVDGVSKTKVESAVHELLELKIVALEGNLTSGRLGYASGLLGTPLLDFITKYHKLATQEISQDLL